jgi:hypothetical protein
MTDETSKPQQSRVVAALAGRRIDARGELQKQFPLENVPSVRESLKHFFDYDKIKVLICSAACGADLVALDVALELGIQYKVILPFEPRKFRKTSVTDRPGNWGALYDRIIESASSAGTLSILDNAANDDAAYEAVTHRIVHDALQLAAPEKILAVIVWEGVPRNEVDATAQFKRLTEEAGFSERVVSTC